MSARRILIMAGGTGGHVFPALSVAQVLRAEGFEPVWLGTRAGIEARLVPAAGINIEWISVSGLRGKGVFTLLLAPVKLLRACWQASRVLSRIKPAVVLGMGGFVSGPGGLMARMRGLPLVIHEQNSIAGMTNRWLARMANRVLAAFPDSFSVRVNDEVVGNPVRESVLNLPAPVERFAERSGGIRVLVLGGSLGARKLNEIVPAALLASGLELDVRHQVGRGDPAAVNRQYADGGVRADVTEFIDDMAEAYAWADIAICRAGAMTIFELAAAGLGAVLVPFPYAVDDHQTGNARYLVSKGAAVLIQERDLSIDGLAKTFRDLAADRGRLLSMANAARAQATPEATRKIAAACMALASGGAA